MKKKRISDWLKKKINEKYKYTCQCCNKTHDIIIMDIAFEYNPIHERDILIKEEQRLNELNGCSRSIYDLSIYVSFEVDHIIPESKGGKTEESNLTLLCRRCNRSKGASYPLV